MELIAAAMIVGVIGAMMPSTTKIEKELEEIKQELKKKYEK